jgi:DNA-binding winged helix-turn-helix (wHTH) protein
VFNSAEKVGQAWRRVFRTTFGYLEGDIIAAERCVHVRFGEYTFDEPSHRLTRSGQAVDLTPKAFALLAALLAARPAVLTRARLVDLLWPRTNVGPTSLPRVMSELRQAIGDTAGRGRRIRTVHGIGYAFSGTALDQNAEATGSCALLLGEREIPLAPGENLIGRAPECAVRIHSTRVSRHHARIDVAEGGACLTDLGSKNGTYLELRRVEEPVALADGDRISIGSVVLTFVSDPGAGRRTETGASKPKSGASRSCRGQRGGSGAP